MCSIISLHVYYPVKKFVLQTYFSFVNRRKLKSCVCEREREGDEEEDGFERERGREGKGKEIWGREKENFNELAQKHLRAGKSKIYKAGQEETKERVMFQSSV